MPLASGDAGIARTVKIMQQLVAGPEGAAHPQIRATALEITKNVASNDRAGERNAIFQFLKDNLKFRGEYQETVQTPLVTLQLKAGDCDDHSTLLAALLQAIGHDTAFKTVAIGGPDYSHVYVLDRDRTTHAWVPLDTTVGASYPGWEAPGAVRSKIWTGMAGIRGVGRVRAARPTLGDASDVLDNLQPLINAAAVRVAYGSNAGLQPFTQNLSNTPSVAAGPLTLGSMPTWVPWAGGLVLFTLFVNSLKGRR